MLEASLRGLSHVQVAQQQEKWGKNILPRQQKVSRLRLFFAQFTSPLVGLLLIASAIAFLGGDFLDVVSILVVLLLNACLGFFQEYRADARMQALRALTRMRVTVKRDGVIEECDAEDLVPGDVLLLRAGMRIGADARLCAVNDFATYEAALTGESKEVEKEQEHMIFLGTTVARGTAQAFVVATGLRTRFARIAEASHDVEKSHGFRDEMQRTTKVLSYSILLLTMFFFALGIFRGEAWQDMAHVSIALGIAALPEGLLVASTVALAVSLQRMASARALVRDLQTPERLSAVNVLCVDKTGTLTTGNMEVALCETSQASLTYAALAGLTELTRAHASLALSLTEHALARFVAQASVPSFTLFERVPFSSTRKYSEVTLDVLGEAWTCRLGAPERVLALLSSDTERARALARVRVLTAQGLRVLVLVCGKREAQTVTWSLCALLGISDPLRPDAAQMVRTARAQGVRLIMLTGDHAETAARIAEAVGIPGKCVVADTLRALSEGELARTLRDVGVVARMAPEDKLRMIRALQADGYVVAMTGDGVNDAPALAAADVGFALQSGTDVAREVADVVLLDDRLETMIRTFREGRGTFFALQRITAYLLLLSLSEMAVCACALFLGTPLPFSPALILWLNMIVDGVPAMGLAAFVAPPAVQAERPRLRSSGILSPQLRTFLLCGVVILVAPLIALFFWVRAVPSDIQAGIFFVAFLCDALCALWCFAHVRSVSAGLSLVVISFGSLLLSLLPFVLFRAEMTMPGLGEVGMLFGFSLIKMLCIWGAWRVILGGQSISSPALVS